jgi:hypothetical protein
MVGLNPERPAHLGFCRAPVANLENWTMTEPHLHWWSDDTRIRVWWPCLALAVGVLVVAFGGILFSHAIS